MLIKSSYHLNSYVQLLKLQDRLAGAHHQTKIEDGLKAVHEDLKGAEEVNRAQQVLPEKTHEAEKMAQIRAKEFTCAT